VSTHAEQTYGYAMKCARDHEREAMADAIDMEPDEAAAFLDALIARLTKQRETLPVTHRTR
jgi:hypothetical protein